MTTVPAEPTTATPAPPAELVRNVDELTARASELVISTDADYEAAALFLNDLGRGITAIEEFFKPHKQKARAVWQGLVDDEKARLKPLEDARAIVREQKMKPFYLKRERDREAERKRLEDEARRQAEERRRQEMEAARKEAEERAREEREAAEARAREEREAAERQAKKVEEEALARAERLIAEGKETEAQRVLDDAQQRQQNLIEDAEETATAVIGQANDIADRVRAEGDAIVQEIAATPVHAPIVSMAAAPKAKGTSAAKKYKANRNDFDKRRVVTYIAAEVARGNVAVLSWVDLNFAKIDQSAGQMEELFPSFDQCGIHVGEDVTIRGSRK